MPRSFNSPNKKITPNIKNLSTKKMKTNTQKNFDIAFGIFTVLLTFLYAPLGAHAYAGEVWNVALNGLKSMDCIKFYAFVSHTAAIGVSAKYCIENVFND